MNSSKHSGMKRGVALVLFIALCTVAFCSALLIVTSAGHHCVGSECVVCYRVGVCKRILHTAFLWLAVCSAVFFVCREKPIGERIIRKTGQCQTLIGLKVKFSD